MFENDLGFEVTFLLDPDQGEFLDAFDAFLSEIAPGDEVVFAFSGHGWADGAENYLALADAPLGGSESRIKRATVPLAEAVLAEIDQRKPGMVFAIIDACRDNPFETLTRDFARGLVPIAQRRGTLVVFAAGTRQKALDRLSNDDPAPYSVFTRVLLPKLRDPNRPLLQIVDETRNEVEELARSIDHPQRPAAYNDLPLSFCLSGVCRSGVEIDRDTARFIEITGGAQLEDVCRAYQGYLDDFPDGKFRVRIERLLNAPPCVAEGESTLLYPEPELVLDRSYQAENFGTVMDMLPVEDGAIIAGLSPITSSTIEMRPYIARLDAQGNVLWKQTPDIDDGWSALLATDGRGTYYLAVPSTIYNPDGEPVPADQPTQYVELFGFFEDGMQLYNRTVTGPKNLTLYDMTWHDDRLWLAGSESDMEEATPHSVILEVSLKSEDAQIYHFATDQQGNEFNAIAVQADGSIRAAGCYQREMFLCDILYGGLDADRQPWFDTYGKTGNEFAGRLVPTPDGGMFVMGAQETGLDYAAGYAILLLRMNSKGVMLSSSELTTAYFANASTIPAFTLDADGGIWMAGFDETDERTFWTSQRVEADAPDEDTSSYSPVWSRNFLDAYNSNAEAIMIDDTGRIWMAGGASRSEGEADFARVIILEPVAQP